MAPAGGGSAGAYGSSQGVKDVLGSLLSAVTLASPTDQEQLAIMEALFPDLTHLLPCAMAVLHLVKRAAGQVAASQAVTWLVTHPPIVCDADHISRKHLHMGPRLKHALYPMSTQVQAGIALNAGDSMLHVPPQ